MFTFTYILTMHLWHNNRNSGFVALNRITENNGGSGMAWCKGEGVLNVNCRLSQVIADSCREG